jgi:O-antigen/teichoic acid export membrane protein
MNRRKILIKNLSLGVFYKILNMGIVFTTIPFLLNYLEKEQYGIWVTIFSLVNIVFFVDAGIGNGLKTKLSEALSYKNFNLAKTYISTAYISILIISFVVLCIGIIFIFSFNLNELFNTTILSNTDLQVILFITLVLIITGFVLNLFKSFYYANQQASTVELAMLIYQVIILISVAILLNFFPRSLLYVAMVYGVSNIVIGVLFTILFFKKNKKIIPTIKSFNTGKVKDLIGLSLAFFTIQLCMIVIFTTDNLIITRLLGPSQVTNYDIVYKLFQVTISFSVIIQDPFWALYTDAYQKKDFTWIRKTIVRLNKFFILFILFVLILYFMSNTIIKFWLQRDLEISNNLLIFMVFFVIIRVYGTIYMTFLNAIGKIKRQVLLYIFGALINIPLSIYFVKYFNLGSSGVILGTIFSILGMSIILPIQTFKILKKVNNN